MTNFTYRVNLQIFQDFVRSYGRVFIIDTYKDIAFASRNEGTYTGNIWGRLKIRRSFFCDDAYVVE